MMVHRVGVLVFDDVLLLDVAGPVQVFSEADAGLGRYEIVTVGLAGPVVRTSSGVRLSVDEVAGDGGFDTLIVPGGEGARRLDQELVTTLQRLSERAGRVASVCTGAFLLAEAGILDGREATTHWRHADLLRRAYPKVKVTADAIFVRSGTVFSSAGVTAGIDLALALVEDDHGASAARDVAQEMVMFMRRPGGQSQFSARLALPAEPAGPLRAVLDAVTADPSGPHTVQALARRAGVSARHLHRMFDRELGMTPSRFVEVSRVEAAQQFLLNGVSVSTAARAGGFSSDETMRRAFQRQLGLTPTAYRERFATTRVL
ncbi:AraC family transcriptional regulator [Kineosporia sp. NBRC 101731]|nr:AraC family transcriptional regulator [Kineosporia sp. NBRC 101731]